MSSDYVDRNSSEQRLVYPLWIPTTSRASSMARSINRTVLTVLRHRARVAMTLTLSLLSVPMIALAESHAQQSSAKRITTPLASPLETLGVERPKIRDVFLPASGAFALTLGAVTADSITVSWAIADGYYLYRDKFQFALKGDEVQAVLGAARFPAGQKQDDPTYGHVAVIYHHVQAVIPWHWEASSTSDITLDIAYQGCADQGLCYPPVTTALILERPVIDR